MKVLLKYKSGYSELVECELVKQYDSGEFRVKFTNKERSVEVTLSKDTFIQT